MSSRCDAGAVGSRRYGSFVQRYPVLAVRNRAFAGERLRVVIPVQRRRFRGSVIGQGFRRGGADGQRKAIRNAAPVRIADRRNACVVLRERISPVVDVDMPWDDFLFVRVGNCFRRQSRSFSLNGKGFRKRHRAAVGRSGNTVVVFVRPVQGNLAVRALHSAADSRAAVVANRHDSAAFAASRRHSSAVDGNLAARAAVAAADSRAAAVTNRRHGSAVDGNLAARAAVAAADSRAANFRVAFGASCRHGSAVDGNLAARAVPAAADSRAAAHSRRGVDFQRGVDTACAFLAAASRRASVTAIRRDRAAVDGNRAACAFLAAADSRAGIAAVRRHGSAVDGNRTGGLLFTAADS